MIPVLGKRLFFLFDVSGLCSFGLFVLVGVFIATLARCFLCCLLVLGDPLLSLIVSEFEDSICEVVSVVSAKVQGLTEKLFLAFVLLIISQVRPQHAEVKSVEEEANNRHLSHFDFRGGPLALGPILF